MLSCVTGQFNIDAVLELDKIIVILLLKRSAYKADGELYEFSDSGNSALFEQMGILKNKHTLIT
jgi:hypothetical protein